jgi:hypothetical protein
MSETQTIIRCPHCGHQVRDFFDHIGIECEHDMTEQEIERLIRDADQESANE